MKQFTRYILLLAAAVLLVSCGAVEKKQTAGTGLRIVLKVPENESQALFWHGVSQRRLLWQESDSADIQTLSVEEANSFSFANTKGGVLRFEGSDEKGDVLVSGENYLRPDQKEVLIPLQRSYD